MGATTNVHHKNRVNVIAAENDVGLPLRIHESGQFGKAFDTASLFGAKNMMCKMHIYVQFYSIIKIKIYFVYIKKYGHFDS